MTVHKCDWDQANAIVWNWDWVREFPSVMCKQLLHQGPGYFVGWATLTADEFLRLSLRDQGPSACLTPPGESHALVAVLARMAGRGWTFGRLASDDPAPATVPRDPGWFEKCAALDAAFDPGRMGPLAIHPRRGEKGRVAAVEGTSVEHQVDAVGAHEVYEGQHRALVLAKKMLDGSLPPGWQ